MTARAVLLLGLLLVALAACVDPSAAPTPTATEPASDRPTGVSQASATSAATGPEMMATIPPGMEVGEVVRVVDGDTAMIEVDGQEERVRYIGINAPESAIPDEEPQCYGPEAAEANERLVGGETVYLERDVSDRDQYGRLLRYVWLPGDDGDLIFVNQELVRQGFADARRYRPDTSHDDQLQAAEREAKDAGRGMWSACN